ncbi:haloacid dehalogenase type II [Duganella sp. LjRoot269]|jgi:2-haloacid dehalogenase|uniref:haloacid dehalogenase type II n=1 Tax=Duganella sp. LjRoot269 TaxID=3342305 RepID=UPI00159E0149
MSILRPKYITFDCYGTLTRFRMADMTREIFADRVPAERMDEFVMLFADYRLDEVLDAWKPYEQVVKNALFRACKRWNVPVTEAEAQSYYNAVPTWGPHADVPEPLAKLAKEFPLVIYSNAANAQIMHNVEKLGAPFHQVFTAENAKAYKPRLAAFEYMIDNLNCSPDDILHVSSSLRYDLMPARSLGIKNKVFVNRGHEPSTPHYGYNEIKDLSGLPALLGL